MKSPIPIADCHGHIGVHPDFPAYKTEPEEMVRVMDSLNIEFVAISSMLAISNDGPHGNADVEQVLRRYPKRFLGYIVVNGNTPEEALEQLQRWSHFHNPPLIKLHPDVNKYPVNGPNFRGVWDYANQTRAIVLVHTWVSDPNCGPLLLAPIAREFPGARILLGHSGVSWRGYEQAIEVAQSAPNTFLDIAGSQSHRTILEHCVAKLGAERLLFGSDLPYLEAAMAVGRVLTARLSDQQKEMILRTNFLRILGDSGL